MRYDNRSRRMMPAKTVPWGQIGDNAALALVLSRLLSPHLREEFEAWFPHSSIAGSSSWNSHSSPRDEWHWCNRFGATITGIIIPWLANPSNDARRSINAALAR
jgi:hypothetical protein